MSEPAKPKRSWLQFHLSTAVVIAFVVGGLFWANSVPWEVWTFGHGYAVVPAYGWPIPIEWGGSIMREDSTILRKRYGENRLVLNWIANIVIVVGIASLLEWRIRRREGRKR